MRGGTARACSSSKRRCSAKESRSWITSVIRSSERRSVKRDSSARTRFGAAALMISANIPDLDVLVFAHGHATGVFPPRLDARRSLAQIALPVLIDRRVLDVDRRRKPRATLRMPFHAGWLLALSLHWRVLACVSRLLEQLRRPPAHAVRLALVLRRRRVHRRSLALACAWRRCLAVTPSTFDEACPVCHRDRHGLHPGDVDIRTRGAWHRRRAVDRGARLAAAGADGWSETGHPDRTRRHRRCRRPLRVGIVFMALDGSS